MTTSNFLLFLQKCCKFYHIGLPQLGYLERQLSMYPHTEYVDGGFVSSGPSKESGGVTVSELSDAEICRIALEVNHDGFATIQNFVTSGFDVMRAFVLDTIVANGDEYTCLTGINALANTPFAIVAQNESFIQLLKRVHEVGLGQPPPRQPVYPVLRCLKGASGLRHSLNFHYDSYAVTALLPVFIPTTGIAGDLMMLKRRRGIRRHYVHNVVDKFCLDNPFMQNIPRHRYETNSRTLLRVKIVPGNLYLFWGYQTVHANEKCDVNQLRATALYHYGNPHADSFLRRYLIREGKG
jgi:hypothetical protein